jgi:hypothetical protein
MQTRRRRALGRVLLMSYASACSSWAVAGPSPEEYLRAHRPAELRVTRIDKSTILLRAPWIQVDLLVGTAGEGSRPEHSVRVVAIPLSEVRTAEVQESNTAMAVGIVVFASLAAVVALELSGGVTGGPPLGGP